MSLIMHASSSHAPVTMAIWGMSPSLWLRGRRLSDAGTTAFAQSVVSTRTSRRHLPSSTTSGTPEPEGTPNSVNRPSLFVVVAVTYSPTPANSLHDSAQDAGPVTTVGGAGCA